MSDRYKTLLDDWLAAAATTREAQHKLKQKFDLFLLGSGPEPSKAEIEDLKRLRARKREAGWSLGLPPRDIRQGRAGQGRQPQAEVTLGGYWPLPSSTAFCKRATSALVLASCSSKA